MNTWNRSDLWAAADARAARRALTLKGVILVCVLAVGPLLTVVHTSWDVASFAELFQPTVCTP